MSVLGNIMWIIFGGGIVLFLEYMASALALCCTIIGIPFGIQCMKIAVLSLVPFGKEVRNVEKSTGCLSTLMNIIWILIGGLWIAITHFLFALVLAITIIGIPFARQHIKLAAIAFAPFGKEIV